MASVARRADASSARDRRPVVSRRILPVVAASYATAWKTTGRRRMPPPHSADGRRKPPLGCSADSRRAGQAGNRGLGTDGFPVLARVPKGIVTDLAHVHRESLRPAHVHLAGVGRTGPG